MKKLFIVVLLVAAAGVYFWQQNLAANNAQQSIASVNGRLEIERLDIASLYAGRVEEIYVQEGQEVSKNQPLVRLSSSQSQSQVDSAQAQIERAMETVSRANAEIAAQQQKANVAKLELTNAKKLRRENLISSSELERRQANYQAALAAVETAKAAKAEAQATVNQAQALSEQAHSQNADMLIKAPLDGRIEYKIATVGSVVGVGGKVISLLDTSTIYLNIFLPAHQVNLVRLNDDARIKIDGSDFVFPAKVVFVAAEAQFTPKSVETSEERSKLMFKIKLQLPTEIAKQYKALLKGGMTAMGYVKYDSQANWSDDLAVKLPSGQ